MKARPNTHNNWMGVVNADLFVTRIGFRAESSRHSVKKVNTECEINERLSSKDKMKFKKKCSLSLTTDIICTYLIRYWSLIRDRIIHCLVRFIVDHIICCNTIEKMSKSALNFVTVP